ncbi:R3H domain-containing protein 4 [Leptinotarsa decemlineata]|uniref:R3H domain-containing protein 4 n=1 Tax=Leptinotarsa decemlineata TaxID=7539 RepID=UPI000C255964|nr:R3H domain-containing protein 4-like [Leptinotarsa decemlineata]
MTVIKAKKNHKFPPLTSPTSDDDTLSLDNVQDSDGDSLQDEGPRTSPIRFRLGNVQDSDGASLQVQGPRTSRIRNVKRKSVPIEEVKIRKNLGRKKLRRYENRCVLQSLIEEDEKENHVVIMESYKGPFTRLLEDKSAMEYWNEFIEKSEKEQTEIVKALSNKYHSLPDCTVDSDIPGRISSRIRRTFKLKKNLSLVTVRECEEDLIEFFKARPEDIYVRIPPTSFDRLLIHAVAQYHRLKSISNYVDEGTRRSVEVHNTRDNWSPANCQLSDFIERLRK